MESQPDRSPDEAEHVAVVPGTVCPPAPSIFSYPPPGLARGLDSGFVAFATSCLTKVRSQSP